MIVNYLFSRFAHIFFKYYKCGGGEYIVKGGRGGGGRGHHGRDHMVVIFTTTYAITAYYH